MFGQVLDALSVKYKLKQLHAVNGAGASYQTKGFKLIERRIDHAYGVAQEACNLIGSG